MSVYNGFATRQLEAAYNHLLLSVMSLMSSKLVELKIHIGIDKEWSKKLVQVYNKMVNLEQIKYLDPKFSTSLVLIIGSLKPNLKVTNVNKSIEISPCSCPHSTIKPLNMSMSIKGSENAKRKSLATNNAPLHSKSHFSIIKLHPIKAISQNSLHKTLIREKNKRRHNKEKQKLLYFLNTTMLHA